MERRAEDSPGDLTGKDRPGVTSAVFAALSVAGVEVVDIEQIILAAG